MPDPAGRPALGPYAGCCWRMLGIRWQYQPLESGSHLTGGRWNAPGTRALYLATDYNTAIVEMHQDIIRPGTLVGIDVDARAIADLTAADRAVTNCLWRQIYGVESGIPPSWTLAQELIAAGADGALVPSAQNPGGTNLVLWRWHDAAAPGEGAALTVLDPEAALAGR